MNTLPLSFFDTLRYVKTLKAADVPEKQAEAQAEALRDVLEAALADQSAQLATRADVLKMDAKVELARKDAEAAEQRLNARIDALGNQLVIKLSTVMVAMTGVGVAIAKFW